MLSAYPRKKEQEILTCVVCGKKFKKGSQPYYGYGNDISCSEECFHKKFWIDALKTGIVINGTCYQIADEHAKGFRGFDGRPFKIQLDNGDIYYTTNLWYNGKIPKEYYKGDNARFIK